MKNTSLAPFVFFTIVFTFTFHTVWAVDYGSARAIQVVAPVNHSFHLELNELKGILEVDDIKNRHVVIVSVAGAFRKGKSFLMNFFLKYLYAQVNGWIGNLKSKIL